MAREPKLTDVQIRMLSVIFNDRRGPTRGFVLKAKSGVESDADFAAELNGLLSSDLVRPAGQAAFTKAEEGFFYISPINKGYVALALQQRPPTFPVAK